jgi:hypothetical protein
LRKFLTFILVIAIVIAAVVATLFLTTPSQGKGVQFPLTQDERTLLAFVPSSADSFAIIPTAAATCGKLQRNPVTRGPMDEWSAKHLLPRPWMLGGADLVAWKAEGQTSYAIRVDPLRAALLRMYLMFAGDSESAPPFRINTPAGQPMSADDLSGFATQADGLPSGDILVVQREGGRAAFPPIARPAVSSIAISADRIDIVSHAAVENRDRDRRPGSETEATQQTAEPAQATPTTQQVAAKFARGALMSMWFASAPRAVDDLNRLFGARVSALVSDGGQIVLYEIDSGKLLPRPRGVFVLPKDDTRRDAIRHLESLAATDIREALGVHIDFAEGDRELFVAFDRTSIPQYLKDGFDPPTWPANRWAARMDAQRFVPVLERLESNLGLRIATPRLYRSARDLERWTEALREARWIEAADSASGSIEELRVRIVAK